MEWYHILAVISVGFAAGFINTLAGSGSLITLPMLMFLGLPANVANGTNRVGVLLQSAVAVARFKKQKAFTFKESLPLTIPAIIGSILGAALAVEIDEQVMELTIGFLLIAMFFLLIFKPKQWITGNPELQKNKPSFWQIVIFFFIGIYGGFIQAGVGLFLLAGLVMGAGFDLVKANAIKLLIVLLYTPFAMAVFFMNNQIDWAWGIVLAIGNIGGALAATQFAALKGAKAIRYILLSVLLLSALELFGMREWIFG